MQADSHNRESRADGCPSAWTFSPAFGIIHAKNCPVCRPYMMHIAVANQSGDASFRDALNDREKSTSTVTAFLDGVQNGRQLQQEHCVPVLDRYREERDKALHSLEQNVTLLDTARKEIKALQDLVLALRSTQHDSASRRINEVPSPFVAKSPATSDLSSIERLLLSPSTDLGSVDDLSTPASSRQALADLSPIAGDIGTQRSAHQGESPKASKTPDIDTSAFPSYTSVLSSVDPPRGTNTHKSTPSATLKPIMSPPLPVQRPASVPAQSAKAHILSPPTTVSPLQPLRAAARNADDGVFRTEIYVDASQWGVGFVMDGSWVAWKFSDLLALSGGVQIDINWAEMLAVEVGLWTVVHWVYVKLQKEGECFNSVEVLVRCDNAGVVKAIERRHASFQPQQEILRRIIDMADEYDIELAVKWVPSMDNLADNPSRGVPSFGATLLPFVPLLPSYLSDTLNPISTI